MPTNKTTKPPAKSDRYSALFRLVVAVLLGAASALAVMRRSAAPASPKTGPVLSAIFPHDVSPAPDGPAVRDLRGARFTLLGAEPAQYMLATSFGLVALIAWRINRIRIDLSQQDIHQRDEQSLYGSEFSSDAVLETHRTATFAPRGAVRHSVTAG